MAKNDFDIDFDFEKEYGFRPKKQKVQKSLLYSELKPVSIEI